MSRAHAQSIPWASILSLVAKATAQSAGAVVPDRPPTPFAVLVTTMISPRTKDEVTEAAAGRLLRRASTPRALGALSETQIARLIYPAGFYRSKARHLRSTCRILELRYASRVPAAREELLELPGVGRKIANLVLSQAFGIDAICVDTHVHRISNRVGWVSTRNPHGTEEALARILPVRHWSRLNHLLVPFGKRVCTPQSPRCSSCPIRKHCARTGVGRSR